MMRNAPGWARRNQRPATTSARFHHRFVVLIINNHHPCHLQLGHRYMRNHAIDSCFVLKLSHLCADCCRTETSANHVRKYVCPPFKLRRCQGCIITLWGYTVHYLSFIWIFGCRSLRLFHYLCRYILSGFWGWSIWIAPWALSPASWFFLGSFMFFVVVAWHLIWS